MSLDPIVAAMLEQMAQSDAPAMTDLPPADARAMYRAMNAETHRAELHEVRDLSADGIPIRIYRPSEGQLPCLVYFHGGGWVIGDLETHDAPCRHLANKTGCVVIAVDYSLAPEDPYPASINDAYAATCWIAAHASELAIDDQRIAVGGDSAGGNLAACVALRARDEAGPQIIHQMLVYPVTDAAMDTPSYEENATGYMLTKDSMTWFWNHYADEEQRFEAYASPLRASSLTGLPAATIVTAGFDPLRDEGEAYGARLSESGVQTLVKRYDGLIHGFFSMTDVVPAAEEAMDLCVAELKSAFES